MKNSSRSIKSLFARVAAFRKSCSGRHPFRLGRSAADRDEKLTRYCLDPWCYLETTPTLGLKPCCKQTAIAQWEPQGPSLESLRNSEPYRALRKSLLEGNLLEVCRTCHIRPMAPVSELKAAVRNASAPGCADACLEAQPLRQLRLEITTRCNLRCVYCPASQPWYAAQDMPAAHFGDILTLLKNHPRDLEVMANGHGETTCHPQWLEICQPLLEMGFRPSIITNLARLLDEKEAGCLAGFKEVQISMDTVDAQLLNQLRRSVKLPVIVSNIENIRSEAFANWVRPPNFSISCGIYDANYRGLDALADFAIKYGMSAVTFWQLVKYADIPGALNVYPVTTLDKAGILDAVGHVQRAIEKLHQAGIYTEVAGDFLQEWQKLAADVQQ